MLFLARCPIEFDYMYFWCAFYFIFDFETNEQRFDSLSKEHTMPPYLKIEKVDFLEYTWWTHKIPRRLTT